MAPNFWNKVFLIFKKDLKDEIRTLSHLLGTLVFGLMLVFTFSYALQLADLETSRVFSAALWVSIYFSASLALQRAFAKEVESGTLEALLMVDDQGSSCMKFLIACLL